MDECKHEWKVISEHKFWWSFCLVMTCSKCGQVHSVTSGLVK